MLSLMMGWGFITKLKAQLAAEIVVLHVQGQVNLADRPEKLQAGQKISSTAKLSFENYRGQVIAWDLKDGLVELRPIMEGGKEKPTGLKGSWPNFAQAIQIASPRQRIEKFSNVNQLKSNFEGRKYLILEKSWLIAEPKFKLDGDTLLIVKYHNDIDNFEGSSKLTFRGDSLFFDRGSILSLNGEPVDPQKVNGYTIWWLCKSTRKFKEISFCEFIFADEKQLEDEVGQLLAGLNEMKAADKLNTVRKFMLLAYGEPDEYNFRWWMARHFPELKQ